MKDGHSYIYIYIYIYGLKSSYDVDIFADDEFFDQWDPRIATPMKEMCGSQGGLC